MNVLKKKSAAKNYFLFANKYRLNLNVFVISSKKYFFSI